VGVAIISYLTGGTSGSGLVTLALIISFLAFRKELLWRVRNRLLVTYFIFGVVPIFVIALLLVVIAELMMGQFAAERVHQALEARIEGLRSTAQNLALAATHGSKTDVLDGIRQRVPKLEAVIRTSGDILRLPADGELQASPSWIAPGFGGLFESGGRYYMGANARDQRSEAFVYFPLNEQSLESITPGVVSVAGVLSENDRTDIRFGPAGSGITAVEKGIRTEIVPPKSGPRQSWWDVPIAGMLTYAVQTPSGKTDVLMPLMSRPSLLLGGAVTGRMAPVALAILISASLFFLTVEVISLFSSWRLTRTITRSVDDLYRGTLRVADGDFSTQIPVRGEHQLSKLANSFNGMTARIHQLIGEVKKKEKLEAELEIAREVQLRLFPKSVPKLKTLEIAAICLPGRVVSGDYYDYVSLDERWTAIALGDVSGKGVSAALLMASIQSALHAQLRFNGASSHAALATGNLMSLISQQLYESTPPEKYATFFCSVYDDETGRLTYTNAGHLKPILVRDGQALTLEGGGMVAGLLPNVEYEQQDVLLRTGDLVAIFSDGIPEAENAEEQEFGEARLAELLIAEARKPLDEIIRMVTKTVEKWIHNPEGRDDVTLLLLRKCDSRAR
jgi:sigma-B regulation protein RsbU (phosphoserine phosphatase)